VGSTSLVSIGDRWARGEIDVADPHELDVRAGEFRRDLIVREDAQAIDVDAARVEAVDDRL